MLVSMLKYITNCATRFTTYTR